MITENDLLNSGYRKFETNSINNWAIFLFQKKIYDRSGKNKYFINIYEWIHPGTRKKMYETDLHFTRGLDSFTFKIHSANHHTIEDIEDISEEFWDLNSMDKIHDDGL